ncbi:MAG: hypothetical protein K6F92_04165 [Lachnospiraceae bacterium]|nr:hypothetical protein [Lachnospiraceae bacterium]
MSYKIAIGSSDGIHVDLKFGEVENFLIYEVSEETELVEKRKVLPGDEDADGAKNPDCASGCGAGSGCGGHGNGCAGSGDVTQRVALIEDCRCIVCKKVGFMAQKQFEKRAISVFDVDCTVGEALEKITAYYKKMDSRGGYYRRDRA